MADTFRPTQRMASAARRGLRLREKFGRGGTDVGVRRAHQLVDQRELDSADVKSMHSYFARHAVDKDTALHRWNSDADLRQGSSHGCYGAAMPERHGPSARSSRSTEAA